MPQGLRRLLQQLAIRAFLGGEEWISNGSCSTRSVAGMPVPQVSAGKYPPFDRLSY